MSDANLIAVACIIFFAQWMSFKLGQWHERQLRGIRLSKGFRGGVYECDFRSAYPTKINSDYGKKK